MSLLRLYHKLVMSTVSADRNPYDSPRYAAGTGRGMQNRILTVVMWTGTTGPLLSLAFCFLLPDYEPDFQRLSRLQLLITLLMLGSILLWCASLAVSLVYLLSRNTRRAGAAAIVTNIVTISIPFVYDLIVYGRP